MPSFFFKIGTTDISAWVDIQNYAINCYDVSLDWTDGNGVEHKEIYRTRYEGSFQAGFRKSTDFSSFMTLLANQKNANGYYPVSAYISNKGSTETFNAFLTVENPEDKWDTVNSRQWQVCNVEVRQC